MCFSIFTDWLVLRHSNVETVQSFQSRRLNSKKWNQDHLDGDFCQRVVHKRPLLPWKMEKHFDDERLYTSVSHADLTSISGVFVTSLRMPPHPWLGFVWLQTSPLTRVSLITTAADCWFVWLQPTYVDINTMWLCSGYRDLFDFDQFWSLIPRDFLS